jgi:acyl dehydratase
VILDLSLVGIESAPAPLEWVPRDVILYALGVGAGQREPSEELQFTTDNSDGVTLQVLPTFAVAQAMAIPRPSAGTFSRAQVLHGEQSYVLHEPLEPTTSAIVRATLVGVFDYGRSAHVVSDLQLVDAATSRLLLTTTATIVVRGEGGFGGQKRSGPPPTAPTGDPDLEIQFEVRHDLALLYRLSGDRNPLHSDPSMAKRAGFVRPILHGMCTFGISERLLINELCSGDASRVTGMGGRFTKPVLPGNTLTLKGWVDHNEVLYRVENDEAETVLDHGHFNFDPSLRQ